MRRKMMRVVAMLLAAVMLITGLPMEAFARETDPVGMTENTANDNADNENSELMEQYEKLRLAHEQEMMEEYHSELEKNMRNMKSSI